LAVRSPQSSSQMRICHRLLRKLSTHPHPWSSSPCLRWWNPPETPRERWNPYTQPSHRHPTRSRACF
jgi:hypothetical protein